MIFYSCIRTEWIKISSLFLERSRNCHTVKRRYLTVFFAASSYLRNVPKYVVFFHKISSKKKVFARCCVEKNSVLHKTLIYSFAVYEDKVFALYRIEICCY